MTKKIQIKHRYTGAVLFECDAPDDLDSGLYMRHALEKAMAARADLRYSNLSGSDLSGSDLSYSNLSVSDLSGSDLRYSNLSGSDLRYSNLSGSDLSYSNLSGSDLSYSNLSGSDLSCARGADLAIAMTRILPEGSLIGWKKCKYGVIVKLRIPEEAKRSHAFGRKCRAEYADVLEVIGADVGISQHDEKTEYRAGQRVTPDSFDDNWQDECSNGVHFFITRAEAEAHR